MMRTTKLFFAVALILTCTDKVDAQEVYVQAGELRGHGVLRARGTECFVLVPDHVITGAYEISVIGRNDIRSHAAPLRSYLDEHETDLAVLRLTDGDEFNCDPWFPLSDFGAMVKSQKTAALVLAGGAGQREFIPVDINRVDGTYIYIRPSKRGTRIQESNSGAALLVNGALAGFLEKTDRVLRLDRIRDLTDEYFASTEPEPVRHQDIDLMDTASALTILDRATSTRDGSNQGQAQAVRALLAQDFDFTGVDWGGLSFRDATLAGGNYTESRMHMIDLSRADARNATFTGSGLRFAVLERVKMQDGDLREVYGPFINAAGGIFDGANMSYSNFLGGDFRGASFRNAKLRGTSFAFADLRGAVFDNADLTDAHFAGAIFDEKTSFAGTTIENTDVQGAAAAKLDVSHVDRRGVGFCRGPVQLGEFRTGLLWDIRLIERWPASDSPTGYEYDDLYLDRGAFSTFKDNSLLTCQTPARVAAGVYLSNPSQEQMSLDRSYLSKRGRRQAATDRVDAQLALLEEQLLPDAVMKGSGRQVGEWAKFIRDAAQKTSLLSSPYMNSEHLSMLWFANGIIAPSQIREDWDFWDRMAKSRFHFENSVRAEGIELQDFDGWAQFFPAGARWDDLPEDTTDIYREWFLGRTANVPAKLVTHRRVSPCDSCRAPPPGQYHIDWVFPTIPLDRVSAEMNSWDSRERRLLKEHGIPIEYARLVDHGYLTTMFVLPSPLNEYRITFPQNLRIPADGWFELDLRVTEFQVGNLQDGVFGNTILFVDPGEVRLRSSGEILWTASLEHVGENSLSKIRQQQAEADARKAQSEQRIAQAKARYDTAWKVCGNRVDLTTLECKSRICKEIEGQEDEIRNAMSHSRDYSRFACGMVDVKLANASARQ